MPLVAVSRLPTAARQLPRSGMSNAPKALQPQFAESWVVIGPTSLGPVKETVGCLDAQVVDAGVAVMHDPFGIELPVLVAVRAIPLSGVVAPLIRKPDCDAIAVEGPEFFDEAILELFLPLASEELDDLLSSVDELGAVAPSALRCVSEGNLLGVAGVPSVFGFTDFLDRALAREGWNKADC